MADAGVKIKCHRLKEGKFGPVLATFMQGPPAEASLTGAGASVGDGQQLRFQYLAAADERKSHQRILSASNEGVKYEAKNFGDGAQQGVYKYALGVYSKKRKRLDVYDADAGGVVLGLALTHVTSRSGDNAVAADLDGVSAKARRDMLIDAFGSRKKKMMEKSKAANIVDVDAVTAAGDIAASLRDTSKTAGDGGAGSSASSSAGAAGGIGISERKVQDAMRAARLATLPPYNELASKPEDAYPFDGLVTGAEVDAMNGQITVLMRAMKDADAEKLSEMINQIARTSQFVRDRLTALTSDKSKATDDGGFSGQHAVLRKRLQALVYVKHLLKVHEAPRELRLKEMTVKPKDTPAESAESAEGTAAAAPATEIGIPSLKFLPQPVQARVLSIFCDKRAGSGRGDGGAAASSSSAAASSGIEDVTYVRTQELQDKLCAYIACLSLIVDNFSSDIRLLAADMKLAPLKLLHFFKELGCTANPIRSGGAGAGGDGEALSSTGLKTGTVISYQVVLKTPLQFPKLKTGRAKK